LKIDSDEKWRHVSKKSPQSYFFGKDTKGKWWGGWQDWSLTGETTYWHPRGDCAPLTAAEKIQRQQGWAAEKKRRDAKKAKDVKAALKRDNAAWDVATPAPDDHPYLLKKGVKAHGLHINAAGDLLIPLMDAAGGIHGLQCIIGDGTDEKPFEKLFTANTNPTGRFHTIGDIDPDGTILIAEGYATAASCHEATGKPCIVAFNCHNLLPVAEGAARAYPNARLRICADDDTWTPEGPGHPENPGKARATEAAKAVGAHLAIPRWTGERPYKSTDFNDLAADEGLAAVARCIEAAELCIESFDDLVTRLKDEPETAWLANAKALVKPYPGVNVSDLKRLVKGRRKEDKKRTAKGEIFPAQSGSGKPIIQIVPGKQDEVIKQAMAELGKRGVKIFQQNGRLVRPVLGAGIDSKGRRVKFMTIVEVDSAFIRVALNEHIDWVKWSDRDKELKSIDVPVDIAIAIAACSGYWPFKLLAGAITAPTLRCDGSVLRENGYDPQSCLYLESDIELTEVPDNPSKEDAEKALQVIEGLFEEVSFSNGASKSVALSALLSAVARPMMNVVPAHGVRAHMPGSGKSYIFDIIYSIIRGETCPVIAAGKTEEETEKRIVAALLSGRLVINLDNVNGTLSGADILNQMVTAEILEPRILGKSENPRIDNRHIVFFNGNNVNVTKDMVRRAVVAELDVRDERPEERVFRFDPVAKVKANRGKYLAACFVVLKAYIASGRPAQNFKPKNSFGDWSNVVRAPLVWLGREDPNANAEAAREDDPHRQRLVQFMLALKPFAGQSQRAVPVSKIVELSETRTGNGSPAHPVLHEFVQGFAKHGPRPDSRAIGTWLRGNKLVSASAEIGGRRMAMRLASIKDAHNHQLHWFVETIETSTKEEYKEGSAGSAGSAGSVPTLRGQKHKNTTCFLNKDSNNENTNEKCKLGEEGLDYYPPPPALPASLSTQPLFGEEDGAYDAPFVD
jgi:putative DNA primase/helicase